MRKNICKFMFAILALLIAVPAFKLTAYTEIIATCETIGIYTTKFDSPKSARGKNIKLAAEKIDRIILEPGQEFSFNEAIGPASKMQGFKLAKIFIKGEEHKGYGGGICQVSSTLYNAVLQAGLDVTERHEHSKDVHYVPDGRDATASHGGVDFKFINNYTCPIVIRAYTFENEVTTAIEAVISFD